MEIENKLTLDNIDEAGTAMLFKNYKTIPYIGDTLLLLCFLSMCSKLNAKGILLLLIIFGILAIIGHITYKFCIKMQLNINRRIILGRDYEDETEFKYTLGEDMLSVHNISKDIKMDLDYKQLKRYIETKHYVVIISNAFKTIVFNKDKADEIKLKDFLLEKNPSIKLMLL